MKIDVIKESDDSKDNGPKLYELMDHYGMSRISKDKLRKLFDMFLEDPMVMHGYFFVYCSEDDGLYNTMTPKDLFDNINKYMSQQKKKNPDDPWGDENYD